MDNLRQQIYRINGGNTVRLFDLYPAATGEPGSVQTVPIVVVGTKLDLVNEREVKRDAIQKLASKWRLPFYETSAKRNWYVSEVFEDLVRQMRARYPSELPPKKKPPRRTCVIV